MTILSTLRALKNYMAVTFPTDVTTGLTISAIHGHSVILNTNPGAVATDAWYGALLKITSGDSTNLTVPIAGNAGNTIYIATPFGKEVIDTLIGADVSVIAGPLGTAKIFFIQPPSVQKLVDDGAQHFVYINTINADITFRGLGRDKTTHGARNSKRSYTVQVLCEVPYNKGSTTEASAYAAQTKIFDLTEQVALMLHGFRSNLYNNFAGNDEIKIDFALLEDSGKPKSDISILEIELDFNVA